MLLREAVDCLVKGWVESVLRCAPREVHALEAPCWQLEGEATRSPDGLKIDGDARRAQTSLGL